jgi:25S rRNA (uracil2634-N3)-methyltransferase
MAVGEASLAVGHAAAGDGGRDGERVEATPEVAGKEVPPLAEGMPGIGVVGKGVAAPSEVLPVKIGMEGEEEEEEEEELAEAVVVEEEEEEEEKWLKLYSSMHSILTVGDGDFSFSLSLASRFGSGALIVATSLDASGSFDPLPLSGFWRAAFG